jgi:lipoate-protein ligase A
VVRSITGGGAVLHEQEITYSFITKIFPANIRESYLKVPSEKIKDKAIQDVKEGLWD